ncbi:MAG: serine protease [Planctomycetaceae bacterium]|nr:serine protease [Planctomycetaceae bacterium]
MFKIFRVPALFLFIFFTFVSLSNALTPEQQELFLHSSVKLRVDADNVHSWGTGTIIDTRNGEALILTCGHIFREWIQQNDTASNIPVEVHLYGGKTSAKIGGVGIFCDMQTDIALVAVKPPFPVQAVAVAPPGYSCQSGQTVWSSGCGGGANPSLEQHRIMSLDKLSPFPTGNSVPFHYIQVSGAPVSGRSGGGLFTEDNYLIGVCNTGDPQKNDGQFVPPEVIRQILQSIKLETVYERPSLRDSSIARADNAVDFPPISMPLAADFSGKVAADAAVESPTTLLPLRPIGGLGDTDDEVDVSLQSTGINKVEQATLEEIRRRAQDGDEVILIIRSRRNPEIPSDVIVLNGTSDQFLNLLVQGTVKENAAKPAAQVYTGSPAQTGSQPVSFPVIHANFPR